MTSEAEPLPFQIRASRASDGPTILRLIRELAAYEKLENEVVATPEDIAKHLFGPQPSAHAILAEVDGQAVGLALFFFNFSTFRGKRGLYLEDLFVKPEHRGSGIGKGLFTACAKIAVDRDCGRFEWAVLNWNHPAIGFYRSMGAKPMTEWTVNRLDEESLTAAAAIAPQFSLGTIDG